VLNYSNKDIKSSQLRILHVIAGDMNGGAAKGAINLHNALIEFGISSFVVNNYENSKIDNLVKRGASKYKAWLYDRFDKWPLYFYFSRKKIIFSPGIVGENILTTIKKLKIDVLHLHWINSGFINISDLTKVEIPIVWTMRDAWPFTGGCHMPMNCSKFKNQCNNCEQLQSGSYRDLSFYMYNRKKKIAKKLNNITLVGISPFLQKQAMQSKIWSSSDVEMIENNVDIGGFYHTEKYLAREQLKLDRKKTIILIGNDSGEIWKGHKFLYKLATNLDDKDYEIVSFGVGKPCHKGKNFGFIQSKKDLALIYSAIDVFVFPSTYEPFGKTPFEAASCGAKVVSFKSTGTSDFYDNEEWWYLAEYANYDSLLQHTLKACNDVNRESENDSQRGRLLSKFDQSKIASKYVELYYKVLNR
jgi:glycosyltransferase involved in cell wall biosynthesis